MKDWELVVKDWELVVKDWELVVKDWELVVRTDLSNTESEREARWKVAVRVEAIHCFMMTWS